MLLLLFPELAMSNECLKDQYSRILTLQMPERKRQESKAAHDRVPLNSSLGLICEGLGESFMAPSNGMPTAIGPRARRLTETVFIPTSWERLVQSSGHTIQVLVKA